MNTQLCYAVPSPSRLSTPKTSQDLELGRVVRNLLLDFLNGHHRGGLERAEDVRLDLDLVELARGERPLLEDIPEAAR